MVLHRAQCLVQRTGVTVNCSVAYRAERAERELVLTVALSVCGVNIVMGTADC